MHKKNMFELSNFINPPETDFTRSNNAAYWMDCPASYVGFSNDSIKYAPSLLELFMRGSTT